MSAERDRDVTGLSGGGELELAEPLASTGARPITEALDELELDLRAMPHPSHPPPLAAPPEAPPTRKNGTVEIALPERAPDAQGTLGQTPLAHVLVSLATRKLSGSVVLQVGAELHALVFREGVLERIGSPFAPLGEILATLGTIDADEVDFAVHRAAGEGTALGAQLVADGLAEEDTIATAVAAQTEERLLAIAGLAPETPYAFFAGDDVLAVYPVDGGHADPLAAVMACVRGMTSEAPIDKVLENLGDRRLALHAAAQLPRFGLTKEESSAADILQWSWRPYAELVETLDEGHATLKRVTYALAITKHFDFGDTCWPLGVERPPPRAPRAPKVTAPRATEPDVEHVRSAPTLSPPTARTPVSTLQTRAAAPTASPPPGAVLERPSHPPLATPASGLRARDPAPSPPLETTQRPPSLRSNPAIEFLPLPDARPPSPSRPPADGALDARAIAAMSADERTIEASALRQRAELLLSRNDVAGAERLALQAHHLDERNAEGLALLGWLRAMKPGATSVSDGLKLLDHSLKENPSSDRALFYRGSLLKRASREADAIRDFRKAVELNPKNIDAAREVRLHAIRNGGSEKAGTKRLIGKLFGKLAPLPAGRARLSRARECRCRPRLRE